MLDNMKIKSKVSDGLDDLLNNNIEFEHFFYEALEINNLFLVGGAIRDFALDQMPKDLDLITDGTSDDLMNLVSKYSFRKNRFGGYKLNINNTEIDIWSIYNHWAFEENLFECSFENISKGAFFNFDAITIDLKNFKLDAQRFIDSYKNRLLDLNLDDESAHLNPDPQKNVKRAFKLKEKMKLNFSDRLKEYCDFWGNNDYILTNGHPLSAVIK